VGCEDFLYTIRVGCEDFLYTISRPASGRPPAALGRQDDIISDPALTPAGRWRELLDQ
jgi:hypothetical protein